MIRQKGDRRIGLVSAQARTTKSTEQLKAAVRKVGNSAKAVEKELKAGVTS
jgi:hypothetical protein